MKCFLIKDVVLICTYMHTQPMLLASTQYYKEQAETIERAEQVKRRREAIRIYKEGDLKKAIEIQSHILSSQYCTDADLRQGASLYIMVKNLEKAFSCYKKIIDEQPSKVDLSDYKNIISIFINHREFLEQNQKNVFLTYIPIIKRAFHILDDWKVNSREMNMARQYFKKQ